MFKRGEVMAITDNLRMMVKVCRLYYEENLSQKEISALMGISRPQISRMLTCAPVEKLVSIKINNPFEDETNLGRALAGRYRLKDALVLDTRDGSPETFGRMAAEYLDAYIADGECVGVMSGQTISRVVWLIGRLERRGLECVPSWAASGREASTGTPTPSPSGSRSAPAAAATSSTRPSSCRAGSRGICS